VFAKQKQNEMIMKINLKQSLAAFITLFTSVSAGSLFAKDKTAGEKVDHVIEKTETAAESAKDKIKEVAGDAKEKAKEVAKKVEDKSKELADDAKEKAHEGIDKLK
jgi:polyhydroxyalkanoate synthesis regulator phasin